MARECLVCKEKQHEINRLLKSYKKDKKIYRIVIAIQFVALLLVTAFGEQGIKMALDFAKEILK